MKKTFAIILGIFISFMMLGCGGNSHIAQMMESSECPEAFRSGVPYPDENLNIAFYSWNNSTKQTPFGTGYVIANEDNDNDNFIFVKNNGEIFYGLNYGTGNYEYAKVFDYASNEFDICEGLRCSEKRPVKFENNDYKGLFELIVNGSEEYSGLENLGFFFDTNMSYFFILDFSEDIYADTLNTRMSALKSLRLSTNAKLTERCRIKSNQLQSAEEDSINELEENIRNSSLSNAEKESTIKICEGIKELMNKIKDTESIIKAAESLIKEDEELLKTAKSEEEAERLKSDIQILKNDIELKQRTITSCYNDITINIFDIIKKLDPETRERDETIERKSKAVKQSEKIENTSTILNNTTNLDYERKSKSFK